MEREQPIDPARRLTPGALRRIGLIGAECSGKTTLATALAEALPACCVTEVLRTFVDQEGRPPMESEQQGLLQTQVEREEAVAEACTRPWLVADPAPLMTAAYSVAYFDDDSLTTAAVRHAEGYDLVVWCAPDFTWQPDPGQRDGEERRAQVESVLATRIVPALSSADVPVLRTSGTLDARAGDVLAWLRGHADPSP